MSSRTLARSRARAAPRGIAALTVAAALAALGIAFAAEWWAELVPCALCLVERWPYRIAAGLGVAALVLPPRAARAALMLAVAALLGGAVVAAIHVGVEFRWWPSPLPECAAPHLSGSIADRLAQMPARPSKPCDDPTYLVPFLPVSMAAMNMLYALAFAGLLAMSLAFAKRRG